MSSRQYFLLGEFVFNLKRDVFKLMDQPGQTTNRKLLQAKELLINISKLVCEGSEKYKEFYDMFETACKLYYEVFEEVRSADSDYEEDDLDDDHHC
jgi:hypothetical protein